MQSPERPAVLFLCSGNYYRSRFAELLFNHRAARAGASLRAESAGLLPSCWTRNPGPISPEARTGLEARGIPVPSPCRAPRDVTDADLAQALLIVALKRAEHEPLLRDRFASWLPHVRFWNVDDLQDAPPAVALSDIEAGVALLLREIGHAPPEPSGKGPASYQR